MFEQMKWEDAYKLWNGGCYDFYNILSSPAIAEPVFVGILRFSSFFRTEAASAVLPLWPQLKCKRQF